MVRKAEANLIKVDQAPAGENILLPENGASPTLSQQALQNLAGRIKSGEQPKPVVLPSKRHRASLPPPFKARAAPAPSTNVIPVVPPPQAEVATPNAALPLLSKAVPYALGAAAIAALGSGYLLYEKGQALYAHNIQPPPAPEMAATTVQAAPERTPPAPVSVPNTVAAARPALEAAAEPEKESALPGLVVRPKSAQVMLRQGPGLEHKELGFANPDLQYLVTGWKDRWFQVLIQGSKQAAWVRNDLVDLTRIDPDDR
jgi:hypothetical protein